MASTSQSHRRDFNLSKNRQKTCKKVASTVGLKYSNSAPSSKRPKIQVNLSESILPINLFHTPGEYNKMLIQFGCKQKITHIEKGIGIIRTLQFINDPVFDKQKQKRQERIKNYEKKVRQKSTKTKADSVVTKCMCCCCDEFCKDCASNNAFCQKQQVCILQRKSMMQKNELPVGIQSSKKKQIQKMQTKTKALQLQSQKQSCQSRNIQSKHRIEELINNTLVKTIQQKRNKELLLLSQNQRRNLIKDFNESVRITNRNSSASKSRYKSQVKQSKDQIRKAYWQSIKDFVTQQLKRPKKQESKITNIDGPKVKKTKPYFSVEKMQKLRVQRGKKANQQIIRRNRQKSQLAKIKMKKLLALDAKQALIMKNCRISKFIPTQQMIQNAFINIA